ncbi:hypothetical protein OPV22_032673 [Ensete ventricosum]|uniref:Uncharacterized protein n=1 Tax=Ensete ventricosum TaxID=4639 RepID=A0AAV8PX93_ENSVE|nr:hypothetical protein OPV22_032673 [Ensete ventricosum]
MMVAALTSGRCRYTSMALSNKMGPDACSRTVADKGGDRQLCSSSSLQDFHGHVVSVWDDSSSEIEWS